MLDNNDYYASAYLGADEAKELTRTANAEFKHYQGCNRRDPDNCSGCALTIGGADGPNYAAWARVYIEARRPIPITWRGAFEKERKSENKRYAECLERSIAHYGVKWSVKDSNNG